MKYYHEMSSKQWPSTSGRDKELTYPYNYNTLLTRQVMRVKQKGNDDIVAFTPNSQS